MSAVAAAGVAAACLVLAAVAVSWPRSGRWVRGRRVVAGVSRRPLDRWAARCRRVGARLLAGAGPAGPLPFVAAAALLAAVLGGAVAGIAAGAYGALAVRAVRRRRTERSRVRTRTALLDTLMAAAGDLRAGLPAGTALAGLADLPPDPVRDRVWAATGLAERTGAPLADLLERIEADARGTERARTASAAQAAGSRATAGLLAALPAGGIGLGYVIGADPLAVLLHTPAGAACAVGGIALQLAGLAWAGRIARPAPVVSQ